MDFSKASDMVKHILHADKLKSLDLNPYILNWYLSFSCDRQQRVEYNNSFVGEWEDVNTGTTQESVSGPYLQTFFLNDLNIQSEGVGILFSYAGDTNIVIRLWKHGVDQSPEVVDNFLRWSEKNFLSCNPSKCIELILPKKDL